ncbi:unnamed protein product [Pleuronectes platessa]|uniref:Uncharacterized protein n=1 Tax=Pleuronectes platessa TaxID=8262 RepID=A0A9N7TTU2_PLEPL|nr:unnamed protein product [Pleuronectes platessa]
MLRIQTRLRSSVPETRNNPPGKKKKPRERAAGCGWWRWLLEEEEVVVMEMVVRSRSAPWCQNIPPLGGSGSAAAAETRRHWQGARGVSPAVPSSSTRDIITVQIPDSAERIQNPVGRGSARGPAPRQARHAGVSVDLSVSFQWRAEEEREETGRTRCLRAENNLVSHQNLNSDSEWVCVSRKNEEQRAEGPPPNPRHRHLHLHLLLHLHLHPGRAARAAQGSALHRAATARLTVPGPSALRASCRTQPNTGNTLWGLSSTSASVRATSSKRLQMKCLSFLCPSHMTRISSTE